jgi:hypothetical protein
MTNPNHDHDPDLDVRLDSLRLYTAILNGDREAADHITRGTGCPRCLAVATGQFGVALAAWAGGDTRHSGGLAVVSEPFRRQLAEVVAKVRGQVED